MFFSGEDVSQPDSHNRAAAQFRLSKVCATGGIDSLDDLAIQHVDLAFGRLGGTARRSVPTNESKTDDRHHHWRGEFEPVVRFDPLNQKIGQAEVLANPGRYSGATECAEHHPSLKSAEPAAKLN